MENPFFGHAEPEPSGIQVLLLKSVEAYEL